MLKTVLAGVLILGAQVVTADWLVRRAPTVSTIASTLTAQSSTASVAATNICTTPFVPITAKEAFSGLNPGWNLGNTLDAIPTEGSWNNPPVQPITFAEIHAKGFKSIRLPSKI
jgi:endoglucanase